MTNPIVIPTGSSSSKIPIKRRKGTASKSKKKRTIFQEKGDLQKTELCNFYRRQKTYRRLSFQGRYVVVKPEEKKKLTKIQQARLRYKQAIGEESRIAKLVDEMTPITPKSDVSFSSTFFRNVKTASEVTKVLEYKGAPIAAHEKRRASMSRWLEYPKYRPDQKGFSFHPARKMTRLLHQPFEPESEDSVVPTSDVITNDFDKQLMYSQKLKNSFAFLNDIPENEEECRKEFNMSRGSMVALRNYISNRRTEQLKRNQKTMRPALQKSKLEGYRLGSQNNAYDKYTRLDSVADDNFYKHFVTTKAAAKLNLTDLKKKIHIHSVPTNYQYQR